MTVQVVTAVGHRHDADVATVVERAPQLVLARRCADLAELLSVVAAGVAEVVVVSADLRGLDRESLATCAAQGVAVVGIVAPGDEESERRLRQLGAPAIVTTASSPEEVAEVVLGLQEAAAAGVGSASTSGVQPEGAPPEHAGSPEEDKPGEPGQILAVWGPTGAPGRTTVATTLAALLARDGRRVLLVDLDTWGAAVAQVLGIIDEAPGVAAAARLSEQGSLDVFSLARVAPVVSGTLRVLTGISAAERWPEIRPGATADILARARLLADVVIVDCGFALEDDEELSYDTRAPRRNGATLTALDEADLVLAVGSADPVGLQRLVRGVQSLRGRGRAPDAILINKVRASVAGARPESAIGSVLSRFAGLEHPTFLPWDPEACDAAMLQGRTLVEATVDSPLVAALEGVSRTLLAPAGDVRSVTARRAGRGPFRARLRPR
ncbi:MAG: ParA family protein [Tetrasphaera sp.]|nr:ParA family protein [Tetrasphaera sp.]